MNCERGEFEFINKIRELINIFNVDKMKNMSQK